MDAFATPGFSLGTMGFIFGIAAHSQVGKLKSRIATLEREVHGDTAASEDNGAEEQ